MKLGWMQYFGMLFKGKKVLEEAINQGTSAKEVLSKSTWKSSEFWMAALTGLGAVAAQAAGILPPPIGPIVMTASGAIYAISRGLAKAPDPLGGVKPGVTTTEFWVNLLSSVGALAAAASGSVSPEMAATLLTVSNSAYGLSRGLAKGGAQPTP